MLFHFLAQLDPTNLNEVLLWVVGGVGAAYLVGRVVSLLLENLAFWHNLPAQLKLVLTMVFSVAISAGAQVLLTNTLLIEQLSPWFTLAMQAILAWLGSQQQYLAIKKDAGISYGIR